MIIRSPRKIERHCPQCDAPVTVSRSAAMRYIFFYQLLRCRSCNTDFEISSLAKLVLLTMASMVIVLALNMETLRELQATEPNLKTYLMAGTLLVTLVFAFILSRGRAFVARKSKSGGRFMLHFATVIAMPGSLLLFALMAELYGKLGNG